VNNDRYIFWHRRDLRLQDNIGLSFTREITSSIIGLFILDQNLIDTNDHCLKISPPKLWFLAESLLELRTKWRDCGSDLLVLYGDPINLIPKVAKVIHSKGVVCNQNYEPYEVKRDLIIKGKLEKDLIKFFSLNDQLLIPPNEINTISGGKYSVYGPFSKKWFIKVFSAEESGLIKAKDIPNNLIGLNQQEHNNIKNYCKQNSVIESDINLERLLVNNGFKNNNLCPCIPGEIAANKQLINFTNNFIEKYSLTRDHPSEILTSKLSASFTLGTISCRQAWQASQKARQSSNNYEHIQSITTWQKELAWREFYQHAMYNFPELSQGPFRKKWKSFRWENKQQYIDAWINGLTGVPIIDAAMRELNETGWMHNRSRMIVASFLVKDLICDWRIGEKYFMQKLVDADLAANNGGWQWSASSGMDPKPLRIFNPYRQAEKFDFNCNYIKKWVPELRKVSRSDILSGDIPSLEKNGYPDPIIIHKKQQSYFKLLYSEITIN
tara:strand:- start:5977 stop:7464 length:1488 start_codon:yes stop_codon:yes gene_type:complete